MKTYTAKTGEVQHGWYVIDAQGKVLGRLAVQIASRLRGKHKPEYTPHVDTGDFVVVVNAAKLRVTGKKAERKTYYRHTEYPGGIRQTNFAKLHAAKPERVLQKAVKGMLPKGPLGYAMLRKQNGRRLLLRHRAAQERCGPRLSEARQGPVRRQRQAGGRFLRARDRPHGRAPAARAHQEPGELRHHGQRIRWRRKRPGGRGAPRHLARVDRV